MTGRTEKPWWLDGIVKLGVPSAIAVFLIWWLTSVVSASLSTIQNRLNEHIATTNIYLFEVCKHTGKTEEERAECPQPR